MVTIEATCVENRARADDHLHSLEKAVIHAVIVFSRAVLCLQSMWLVIPVKLGLLLSPSIVPNLCAQ